MEWAPFVAGACTVALVACIMWWERRADKRWAQHFDVDLPKQHRRYFDHVLEEYRRDFDLD